MMKVTHVIFSLLIWYILWWIFRLDMFTALVLGFGGFFADIDLIYLHRKLLHNVWAGLGTSLIVYFGLGSLVGALAWAGGYFGHMLLDSWTPVGVYWFWPVLKWRSKGEIKTGGTLDRALSWIFFILMLVVQASRWFL